MDEGRWHPGNRGLTQRWSVPVPIFPDELLSSWLVRTALALGCPPLYFTDYLWPKWRCWTIDVDRCTSDERLACLVEPSDIPLEVFRVATLGPVATRTNGEELTKQGRWPWIVTIGARNTKRRGGLSYCPSCLAGDVRPFYRLPWRLAWHTACDRHTTVLLDQCPNCRSPVEPHRLRADASNVALCSNCGADLREASAEPADCAAIAFQREADDVLHRSKTTVFGHDLAASDWFAMSVFYLVLINSARYVRLDATEHLLAALGARSPSRDTADHGLELGALSVMARHRLLSSVQRFVSADRDTLRQALLDSGLSRQGVNPGKRSVPTPLADIVNELPDRGRTRRCSKTVREPGPRSPCEVNARMARLERLLSMVD